jgi:deoxyadenosine/deoxycytidine kinase
MYSTKKKSELPSLITVAGLIGAGKTSLADALGNFISSNFEDLKVQVHHESVDNNKLLAKFYQDMKRWGFSLQVDLLTQRHRQLQQINWNCADCNIEDRFMDEDHVFANVLVKQGNMDEDEFQIYERMVMTYENHVKRPDLIVFLDVSAEKSLERIMSRGRQMENGIPLDYLQLLHAEYQLFIKEMSKKIPVIRISWEEFQETPDVAALILDRWKNKCFNITE